MTWFDYLYLAALAILAVSAIAGYIAESKLRTQNRRSLSDFDLQVQRLSSVVDTLDYVADVLAHEVK